MDRACIKYSMVPEDRSQGASPPSLATNEKCRVDPGQRGKIGFSTIEERVLASLRGIICQDAEMVRGSAYLTWS